eukprot:783478-Rhodomonas_salina.1
MSRSERPLRKPEGKCVGSRASVRQARATPGTSYTAHFTTLDFSSLDPELALIEIPGAFTTFWKEDCQSQAQS